MSVETDINLNSYIAEEINLLELFRADWLEQQKKSPTDFPDRYPARIDWDEQFQMWKESNNY